MHYNTSSLSSVALIGQVNNVVNDFSGDIYGVVDQAVRVSQGDACCDSGYSPI